MYATRTHLATARALMIALVALMVAGWASTGEMSGSQQPERPPVFRSGVQLLEVDAVATDAQGRPVMDLTKEEFQLYDEGEAQEIAFFAAVSLRIQAPRPPVFRDVASNASAEDGRLFVLVLDDIHSLRATTPVIKAAARRLVERLSPQDQVAVLWMSIDKRGAFEFTTNHAAALATIEEFVAWKTNVERYAGSLFEPIDGDRRDPYALQKLFERLRPFTLVQDVCEYVARIPRRRKAIVYVGQGPTGALLGDHVNVRDRGNDDESGPSLEIVQAVQAARRANVALYVIDPRGPLKPGAEGYLDEPGPLSFRDLARIRQDTMASFGIATGGFWGTGIRAVDLVDRIVTETRQYYLLGYYPPPPTSRMLRWLKEVAGNPWARFRSLEVRTTRPGVTIRARKGYWQDDARPDKVAPAPAAGTATVRAVANVLPQSALPLRALAVPVRGDAKAKVHPVAVAIEVTASPRDGQPERAEVFTVAVEVGEQPRATQRATATFRADGSRTVSRYLLCERLDLKPGRYQVRLGVQSQWAQTTGSVYVDVTVPDYRKDALSMSGLVLDHQSSGAPIPVARPRTIAGLVPALPSLRRTFTAADAVWVAAEIYRGAKAPAAAVEVVTALGREGEADAVWHVRETLPASAFGATQKVGVRVPLPIATLTPGAYRLRITATLSAPAESGSTRTPLATEEPATIRREMDITIEAR